VADVPDPEDPQTFARSKLDWSQPGSEPHAGLLAWYRELIGLRRARPELTDPRLDRVAVAYDEEARWLVMARGRLLIVASLGDVPLLVPLPEPPTAILAASRPGVRLGDTGVTMPGASLAVLDS
jgi:maltooligosyltrehalose trehalohydrolase